MLNKRFTQSEESGITETNDEKVIKSLENTEIL